MQTIEQAETNIVTERKQVEAVETLATLDSQGENLATVAHDVRNMVTALGLYCDLLEEPGVLAPSYAHYGCELRLVADASRRLVEKLAAFDAPESAQLSFWQNDAPAAPTPSRALAGNRQDAQRRDQWNYDLPSMPVLDLAAELLAIRNLLSALAGPWIAVTVETMGGALPVRITGEDLIRVLVNLVKNAVEAMPAGGRIRLSLREHLHAAGTCAWVALTVEDDGPGIPADKLEQVFSAGYSFHATPLDVGYAPAAHRGLGLSICRSIVENAGGRIRAENRVHGGARIVIELPVGR